MAAEIVTVRRATGNDIPFLVSNNLAMAKETENKLLDEKILTRGVRAFFEDDRYGFYCVAEIGGQPAGQLMITYEWSDWRNGVFWWIQSVYIPPAFRRKGVYSELYQFILAAAKTDRACGIRLYVDKDNLQAKKTYKHCGMQEAHYELFEVDFVLG